MSALTRRLEETRQPMRHIKMYSKEGADFQEWAMQKFVESRLPKGCTTHSLIGQFVHEINNDIKSIEQAKTLFMHSLSNNL